jgi:hypothetical protein
MKIRSSRRAGVMALAAFLTTSALGFAGCGATTAATDAPAGTTADATAVTTAAVTSSQTVAWNTCPKGKTDDAYPGDCGQYVDTNDDGICDLSQEDPSGTASVLTLAVSGTSDDQTGYCPLGPCAICGICAALTV